MATVLESSEEDSMMRKQRGMISVRSKKAITSEESILTRAPMTPKEVRRRYSKVRWREVVLRKGNSSSGMCAWRKRALVSGWEATHCKRTSALQTRLLSWLESTGGESMGYTDVISLRRAVTTPNEDQRTTARSSYCSRLRPSSSKACSLLGPYVSWQIQW